jgi:hypothetical protein
VLASKTYIGERLDLEHYKGLPIQGYQLTVLDSEDDPFDFTGYSDFTFDLFAKPHGKSIDFFNLDDPAANVISIDADSPTLLALRPAYYFYEVNAYTPDSPAEKVLISYGLFSMI